MKKQISLAFFLVVIIIIYQCGSLSTFKPRKGKKGKALSIKSKKGNKKGNKTISKKNDTKTQEIKINTKIIDSKNETKSVNNTKNSTMTNNEALTDNNNSSNNTINNTLSNNTNTISNITNNSTNTNKTEEENLINDDFFKNENNGKPSPLNVTKKDFVELEEFFKKIKQKNQKNLNISKFTQYKSEQITKSIKKLQKTLSTINNQYGPIFNSISNNLTKINSKNEKYLPFLMKSRKYFSRETKNKTQTVADFFNHINKYELYKNATLIEPECENRNSCRTCLENTNCFWCEQTKVCLLGDSKGDFYGKCTKPGTFMFDQCEKETESLCENYSSCSECLINPLCGWCEETHMCTDGNSNSAIGFDCKKNYYYHLYGDNQKCKVNN